MTINNYMNIIKKYITYLKDNPEGYWFKRKLYGWGWVPARVQGWLVLGAYIVAVVIFVLRAEAVVSLVDAIRQVIAPVLVLTIILLVVCYKTGEKPTWQWGMRAE